MTAKKTTQRHGFKTNEYHRLSGPRRRPDRRDRGAGGRRRQARAVRHQLHQGQDDAAGARPPRSPAVGMRKLAEGGLVKRALETLKGRARIKRTMWSRRAQEYEAKINSGDIVAIAEVVRDLFRSDTQPEQSYSERQLYEAALDRLSREISAVQHVHRDRGGQGDRGGARQGPAPRSEAGRGSRRGRGRGRGGVSRFARSKNTKGPVARPGLLLLRSVAACLATVARESAPVACAGDEARCRCSRIVSGARRTAMSEPKSEPANTEPAHVRRSAPRRAQAETASCRRRPPIATAMCSARATNIPGPPTGSTRRRRSRSKTISPCSTPPASSAASWCRPGSTAPTTASSSMPSRRIPSGCAASR